MRTKQLLTKTLLLLAVMLMGAGTAWADDNPNWFYTVVDGDKSKLNTTTKTFTVDANHVWSYDGTTIAAGESPSTDPKLPCPSTNV